VRAGGLCGLEVGGVGLCGYYVCDLLWKLSAFKSAACRCGGGLKVTYEIYSP